MDLQKLLKEDEYYTPKSTWEAIANFIPKDKVIWEAFYSPHSKSPQYLKELGFNVISKNRDFFEKNYGDIIVSNPPFSKKKQVLQRLHDLQKPFLLILPVTCISSKYFQDVFKNEPIQLIIPSKRIEFEYLGKKKARCGFSCIYVCWKINLDKDINFLG